MNKIKECPCCGKIEYVTIKSKYIQNSLYYRILCDDTSKGCGLRTAWCSKIEDALDSWNRRNGES